MPALQSSGEVSSPRRVLPRFLIAVLAVTVVFGAAWLRLVRAAGGDELHSYAVAIPLIVGWLLWPRASFRTGPGARDGRGVAVTLAGLSAGVAAAGFLARSRGWLPAENTWLAVQLGAWTLGVWAVAVWYYGWREPRSEPFPWLFLVFTVPLPQAAVDAVEIFLQHSSASAVELLFRWTGITYLRDERSFWLPGLRFMVAQECSGIRSTLVLLITSLLGGYLLLKRPWRRIVFALCVVPLGILRNAVRIYVITVLTSRVDPRIIDSALHHRGGPLFFLVSLVPLFLLLAWFRRQESAAKPVSVPAPRSAEVAEIRRD